MSDFPHGNRYIAAGSKRWTPTRKGQLVEQLIDGDITVANACRIYDVAPDELSLWVAAFSAGGLQALKVGAFAQNSGNKGGSNGQAI